MEEGKDRNGAPGRSIGAGATYENTLWKSKFVDQYSLFMSRPVRLGGPSVLLIGCGEVVGLDWTAFGQVHRYGPMT